MISKTLIKRISLALALSVGLGFSTPALAKPSFSGEYRQGEILSFGASLNAKEEKALREYFNVPSDMEAIYVDNKTAIKQLGLAPDALDNYTGGWYSSAYVKLTNKGGIDVSSKNVTLVTNEMFANALITSGILNCKVIVSAPFAVTGESALAGILAGAEEIMGESLSEENKAVAKQEIDTTLEIAEEILNNKDNEINSSGDSSNVASGIINDIKQQVIKDSPNSTQIQEIIINVTNNYGVELSKEANDRVLSLMEDVNDLDIDYKDIKETIKNIGSSISESLKEAGIKLRDSGILEKIGDWFSNVFKSIGEWFKGLFEKSDEVNNEDLETIIPGDESQELDIKEDSDIKHDIFDVSDLENIDEVEEDTNEVDAIEKETISEDLNIVDGEEISESENENTEADNDSELD